MDVKFKYLNIQGWMYSIGCDSLREVAAYALIYGFSQDGTSKFNGSLSHMQQMLMCSKNTVIDTIRSLEEKGLIKKEQYEISGVKLNRYSIIEQAVQKLNYPPCSEIEPNNNIIDNNNKYNSLSLFEDSEIPQVQPVVKEDLEFERFWKVYDKKVQRAQAEKMWKKLSVQDKQEILERVALYVLSTPDVQYRMNPATYINPMNKRWQDEIVKRESPKQEDDHIWR